jgi:UbiD family decarboxylase
MRTVEQAPCQEIVLTGSKVDLMALPVARHSELDPGPYITGGFDLIVDPEYGTTNSVFTRMMITDRDEGVLSIVTAHSWAIMKKYMDRGLKELPLAVVLGPHPLVELAANLSTYHAPYLGRFLGEPLEMVKCKTLDLEVPAHAEIIIEGKLQLERETFKSEGPSVAPSGYSVPREPSMMPVLKVTAITTRKDPIYRHAQSTCLPSQTSDHVVLPRLCHEAMVFNRLKDMNTEILDVSFPLYGAALTVILQFRHMTIEGQSTDAILCAMGAPWLNSKIVIAVDEDVDIYNPADVFHAVATRVNPETDMLTIRGTRANFMEPSGTPIPGRAPYRTIGKVGIDATLPPIYREDARRDFELINPVGWDHLRLEAFLED